MGRSTFEEYRHEEGGASLEDDWISEAETAPEDTAWFLETAQALVANGEQERAHSLLDLWDDQLRERGAWEIRLEVLRQVGELIHKPARLHREIVSSLEALWGDKPTFQPMLEWVGLRKPVEDPAKLWDRVTRFVSLLVYDVGTVVAMKSQGVGRVAEVNLTLESLKIDFERRSGVSLGFRAAAKMLRPLPPGHLLRRKIEDPDGLAKLRDEDPSELLRAVLETSDKAMSAGEIREVLSGIVSPSQWSSWWAAARRHPQVVTLGTSRQTYRWEASEEGALDAVRQGFDRADPRQRIEILRKNADRDAGLAREFAGSLASIAGECAEDDPGLAWEIFFGLERMGGLPDSLETLAEDLIREPRDPRPLLAGISDRLLRERALTMLRERRADWPDVFRDHFAHETDPRVLSLLADGLAEVDSAALDRLLDDRVAQPRRSPAGFVWLAERAAVDEAIRSRNSLRLLQQILYALSADEFSGFRARLKALTESGGTVPRIFAHLDEEQAATAIDAIQRCAALEPYQRTPLATALEMRFSNLRKDDSAGPLYATSEAIAAKRAELKRIAEIEIPTNRKAIEEARAMGDLRENFEYKSARQRHEYLNARLASLHRDLGRARPIDFDRLDLSEVRVGARVHLADPRGNKRQFTIMGPWESRPEEGVISYESELGQSLLGAKAGDSVQVGESTLRLMEITSGASVQRPSPK